MRILVYSPDDAYANQWMAGFSGALPEAQLKRWRADEPIWPADYLVTWRPPAELLRGRSDLKAIFNLGAGVDAILALGDALPAQVPIVRLDDAGMGIQMAEYVTHAVLRYFRRFDELDANARSGQWQPLAPHRKQDFTIGILGLGVLGTQIARALAHFEFSLLGWSLGQKQLSGVQCFSGETGLDELLRGTRLLICALPLTPQTGNILNRSNLSKLQPGAYLINVARGGHLADPALLPLIKSGQIAGATLDVFRHEPLPPQHPFWQEPRITITPHMAAMTLRQESIEQIAGKIRALERGEAIAGMVDPTRGY